MKKRGARKGHFVSKITRAKISKAQKGKHYSPKTEFKKGSSGFNRKHSEESKKKMSKSHTGKKSPWSKPPAGWNRGKSNYWCKGEKHWNWKNGISTRDNKIRCSLEYTIWRNEVYKRDGWTCRLCGKRLKKGNIVAHHLKLFSDFPELRFSITNGITLCRSCHTKIHKSKRTVKLGT